MWGEAKPEICEVAYVSKHAVSQPWRHVFGGARRGAQNPGAADSAPTKHRESGYPLYSSDESSYPWTRAVGGEDRVC